VPELPEVETIVRQLAPLVAGRTLAGVEILDGRWCAPLPPAVLAKTLAGRRVEHLRRRGKYIVWELDGDRYLVQHLRMTAVLLYDPVPDPPHARVRLTLSGPGGTGAHRLAAHTLVVCDPRRFGTAELFDNTAALEQFFAARLGPEPFADAFTAAYLKGAMHARTRPIKAALLDQSVVAGVGNIYADEALFRASVHPARRAGQLSARQCEGVHAGVLEALQAGIDARGASIDDFRHVDGVRGSFQDRFLVHRREGQPCPRCGAAVIKTVVAGRGTYYCPRCQPAPRARRS
jgi:formamidopyrimidine-DNA glycosylase